MDKLSLRALIEAALVEAKDLHHIAVSIGVEKDENWPKFYADVVVRRLTPIATGMQAHPVAHVKLSEANQRDAISQEEINSL
jgi:hypothetical protein